MPFSYFELVYEISKIVFDLEFSFYFVGHNLAVFMTLFGNAKCPSNKKNVTLRFSILQQEKSMYFVPSRPAYLITIIIFSHYILV